jgi:hypothetical protein
VVVAHEEGLVDVDRVGDGLAEAVAGEDHFDVDGWRRDPLVSVQGLDEGVEWSRLDRRLMDESQR